MKNNDVRELTQTKLISNYILLAVKVSGRNLN